MRKAIMSAMNSCAGPPEMIEARVMSPGLVRRVRPRQAYRPDPCDRWDIGQRVTPRLSLWIAICRRKRAYHSLHRSPRLRHLLGDEPSGPS
jgi:hypothetical protein